ncbi:MAG: flagellar biosynthesis regulator FlaF [Rhodospirillaceae bacterium]|nr:flagellar biosynthesis regulator FlaF [Rhodospirillales bacterium]
MAYPSGGQNAYRAVPQGGNPRETEAWALTETARRLLTTQSDSVPLDDFLAAVRINWRLWTIFQAELSTPECTVPLEIRQNMLSLCNFVDKRSVEIIAKRDRQLATVLINVNRQIAGGLFTTPADSVAAETGDAQPTATTTNELA